MLMRSAAPMVELVNNEKICLCGRGRECICWEVRLHLNPEQVKQRGRNGRLAIVTAGETVDKLLGR